MTADTGMAHLWLAENDADLEFDVSAVPAPRRFDDGTHGVDRWKKVDFILHWPEDKEMWLVEVKDPDNPYGRGAPSFQMEDVTQKTLISQSLAPKAKDSFLYLLLQDQLPVETKVIYLVLFACEQFPPAKRAKYYLSAGRELRRSLGLGGPLGGGWVKRHLYIQECLILSLSEWNDVLGTRVRVRRLSSGPGPSVGRLEGPSPPAGG